MMLCGKKDQEEHNVVREMGKVKLMTKSVSGLDRRPCGSFDNEDKKQ